ncbi:anaerobic ribonucleoside-triphosphate reductase activating protein [Acidaminobacter hydrogenoformans]|uniref:Pyruvate formate lyase activating enzyme n=1 Tax=Acidaminobacter hydrogenoformans DSM 2784 TaxID=1120920 RepID=A0A1G5S3S9_9FIRM|nr:anaerobic ribonucleoside-triphosphate reductase activating protein [Acidaminobacter hydrogenoformans]SCZ80797.1 pyruvate formate lyase activating enzyme [Acidaminobacter hydrogenoformans DSM 2784]
METLEIGGLIKTTLIDFPGEVATVLFTTGCNFNCPYCHNRPLILPAAQTLTKGSVMAHLEKRAGLCDGVVISGGEPTLQPGLEAAVKEIRRLGYKVKLDTNGTRPDVLERLLSRGLLDYVAMDVKSSPERHKHVTGGSARDRSAVEQSIALLMASPVAHEFRTTVAFPLHDYEEVKKIGESLLGAKRWVLQAYKPAPAVPAQAGLQAPPMGTLEAWKTQLEQELEIPGLQIELRTGY